MSGSRQHDCRMVSGGTHIMNTLAKVAGFLFIVVVFAYAIAGSV